MLVRSASTPMLNSWCSSHSAELSPESDHILHLPKTHSMALSSSFTSLSDCSTKRMTRARSENDLRDLAVQKRKPCCLSLNGLVEAGEEEEEYSSRMSLDQLFSSSGLDESVEEGGGIGSDGGSDGGVGDGFSGFSDSNHDRTDAYYQKMIKENPGNSLLLGNYAKFLKEVKGDVPKAEEYCERAILVNPSEGSVLSMYADLMWESHRDAFRAERYFDQAVQAAPDDSYVMASYARFLWDVEEEEDEEQNESCNISTRAPDFFQGKSLPLTAVS